MHRCGILYSAWSMGWSEGQWTRRQKKSLHRMPGGDAGCDQFTEHARLPRPSCLLPRENESVRGLPRTHFAGGVLPLVPRGHFPLHGAHVGQPLEAKMRPLTGEFGWAATPALLCFGGWNALCNDGMSARPVWPSHYLSSAPAPQAGRPVVPKST